MKRLLLLLLALLCALSLCLVSCNDGADGKDKDDAEDVDDEEKDDEEEKEDGGTDAQKAKYEDAKAKIEAGEYEAAYALLKELGDYKDAEKLLGCFYCVLVSETYIEWWSEDNTDGEEYQISLNEQNLPAYVHAKAWEEYEGEREEYEAVAEIAYDDKGNRIQVIERLNGDTEIHDYTYDQKGCLTKWIGTSSDGSQMISEYFYNTAGQLVKYVFNGKYITEYTYDEKGNLTSDGSLYQNVYDTEGNLVKKIRLIEFGDDDVTEYTYDAAGRLIKKVENLGGYMQKIYTTNYTYDEKGRLIQEAFNDSKMFSWGAYTVSYTYDAYDNVISEVSVPTALGTDDYVKREREYKLVYIPIELSEGAKEQIKKLNVDDPLS